MESGELMEIRQFKPEECDKSLELSMYAFQYELSPEQLESKRQHFKADQVWGAFEEDKLCAKLTILPFHIHLNNTLVTMGGIAGVATWPEERRRGAVAKLLTHSLHIMKEQGQTISFLMPFSYPFYRKFGWENCVDYKNYKLLTAQLPPKPIEISPGSIRRYHAASEQLIAELQEVYSRYVSRYNGALARDEDWWMTTVFERRNAHIAIFYGEDNKPVGYVNYRVTDRTLTVFEFIALDENVKTELWRFLSNHDSMIDQLTISAPIDDTLAYLLPDPRIGHEIVSSFMGRIVDVAGFLQQYPFTPHARELELTLDIADAYAPWNNGTFRLSWSEDGVVTVAEGASSAEIAVSCSIQTLTSMFIGYKRPSELHRIGRLQANRDIVALLEQILPERTTYMPDFF
ncbi:GNAT family N-acetyltransferase [Paenibacillaceae bacterium]|nr:GNAT family N-acetyltransferase [Paenibacillaceae bacterium]